MASEYLCAFLQPDNSPILRLGDATRIEMPHSTKHVDAAMFLYHLLFHSPNPWKLEEEYLQELRKLPDPANVISEVECAFSGFIFQPLPSQRVGW